MRLLRTTTRQQTGQPGENGKIVNNIPPTKTESGRNRKSK